MLISPRTSLRTRTNNFSSKRLSAETATLPRKDALTKPPRSEFASKDLKSVGNYTLGRLIGKGSFGKVYLASHKLINGSKVRGPDASPTDLCLPLRS